MMPFCTTGQRRPPRRPLHVLILLAVVCALAACGGGSRFHPPGPTNPPPEPPPPPPPPPAPEPELQTVAGRDALRERILAAGGFRGMAVVHDWSEGPHAARMRDVLLEERVPEDRIAVPYVTHVGDISNFLRTPEHADLISRTRVVAVPLPRGHLGKHFVHRAASEGAHGRGLYSVERSWRRVVGTPFRPTLDDQAGCDGPIPTASTSVMRLRP